MRARSAQKSGTRALAHRTLNSTCPVCTGHPGGPRRQKLQRSNPNGVGVVAGAPDMSGVHRTVRCTIGLKLKLATFGNFQRHSAIIHRTVRCTPDSVRCSKEARPPELASLGNAQRLLRYNSPDMSGVHRTVR
jgi:hypothetical protein